jgi:hypothetical protein
MFPSSIRHDRVLDCENLSQGGGDSMPDPLEQFYVILQGDELLLQLPPIWTVSSITSHSEKLADFSSSSQAASTLLYICSTC